MNPGKTIFSRNECSCGESRRDSATKPRVARNELPWVIQRDNPANSERVASDRNASWLEVNGCNPFRVDFLSHESPMVARASQPWAKRYNPFGFGIWIL